MTVDGQTLTIDPDDIDDDAGIIYGYTAPGLRNVQVTLSVGSARIAPNVRLAALEEIRYLWQIGRQGPRPVGDTPDSTSWTPSGFAVPKRVIELMADLRGFGGFA